MKRQQIVSEVESHLGLIGVSTGQFVWQPAMAQLLVVIGERIHTLTLRSGTSRRALTFELGRLAGLAEAAGLSMKNRGA